MRSLVIILTVMLFAGCNLFSSFADNDSYRSLINKGNKSINDSEYADAQTYYEKAMKVNPAGSEAYFFRAKAILKRYGLSYPALNDEFEGKKDGGEAGVPFIDSSSTLAGVDSVYYPISVAVSDLEHIIRGEKDTVFLSEDRTFFLLPDGDTASDGIVSAAVATLDLGLLQAIKAMLAPIDIDGNFRLDSLCGEEICSEEQGCEKRQEYERVCTRGRLSEVIRLESYKILTSTLRLDSISSEDVDAKDVSNNPGEINSFLDAMKGPASGSGLNLGAADASVKANSDNEEFADALTSMTESMLDLKNFLTYMRHNDSTDNDYDGDGTLVGRMVWHDYDKDGYIRYDYDEDLGSMPEVGGNIGHPIHRNLHQDLYLTMKEFISRSSVMLIDTSVNSRVNQMISNCEEKVQAAPLAGLSAEDKATLTKTCSSISSVLKPDVKPPARSDWLSGPFGLDEEILDGKDNDMDGLLDEDSRNMVGTDDDNDAVVNKDMIGTNPAPMLWNDENKNGCIDIDASDDQGRKGCIGTLEHRLDWARNRPDSLALYYSDLSFSEDPQEQIDECLADILRTKSGLETEYTTEEQNIACSYKHIWIAEIPSNSEWKSGVFGMDEEKLDGIDNDGDGWVDEDVEVFQ